MYKANKGVVVAGLLSGLHSGRPILRVKDLEAIKIPYKRF